jgi:hypothetical protein
MTFNRFAKILDARPTAMRNGGSHISNTMLTGALMLLGRRNAAQ